MQQMRIVIADDHRVVRAGLRALLEQAGDCQVCGEAGTGREAVTLAAELSPDVVVMDLAMPELNGLEATRQIARDSPRVAVLMLSASESEEVVRQVLTAGARGFVLKSDAAQDLVAAVKALCGGQPFFSPRVSDWLLKDYLRSGPAATAAIPEQKQASVLTAREREVLQLLAEGQSNKEVAAALGIGVKTAEAHRANLVRKLGMKSLPELVRYAIRNHIVEL